MNYSIKEVREFAIKAHGDQKYGNHPYSYHLDKVVSVLLYYTTNDTLLKVGYLHDVLEDTSVDYDILLNKFGKEIAELVWRVTDEPGQNRKERKAKTYPKTQASYKAVIVKTADRIANVLESKGSDLFQMYAKEHNDFVTKVIGDNPVGILSRMKNDLEKLMK